MERIHFTRRTPWTSEKAWSEHTRRLNLRLPSQELLLGRILLSMFSSAHDRAIPAPVRSANDSRAPSTP